MWNLVLWTDFREKKCQVAGRAEYLESYNLYPPLYINRMNKTKRMGTCGHGCKYHGSLWSITEAAAIIFTVASPLCIAQFLLRLNFIRNVQCCSYQRVSFGDAQFSFHTIEIICERANSVYISCTAGMRLSFTTRYKKYIL